eukprot:Clim_evm21s236 gene=Clim_evmTU21s236
MSQHAQVLRLYRNLHREVRKFSNYNLREYGKRKVRDTFKANKDITDPAKIDELLAEGQEELLRTKRMTVVNNLFQGPKLIIEQESSKLARHP